MSDRNCTNPDGHFWTTLGGGNPAVVCATCGTFQDVPAPTASRERETPMSARDQQVVEARREYDAAICARHNIDSRSVVRVMNAYRALEAALLTTHRRQVLAEIEEKIRTDAGWRWRSRGEAADFVASLRDTKENDR